MANASERIARAWYKSRAGLDEPTTIDSLAEHLAACGVDDAFDYAKDAHDTIYEGHSCQKDDYWACQIMRKLGAV